MLDRAGLVAELDGRAGDGHRDGVALLFLHVDRFDLLNGRLGWSVGDEVLRAVAKRLTDAQGDGAFVGRTADAGFVVVRAGVDGSAPWAHHVASALAEPVTVGDLALQLSCAAVLVTVDRLPRDARTLLTDAEYAARRAMGTGRSLVEHVRLATEADGRDGSTIAASVQQAVAAGDIVAEYQPVVDLRSMEPVGVEALARWRGAAAGYERPEDFLEVVTALGLRPQVFDAILGQVCADFVVGPPAERGWWVSVNLGVEECSDQTLPGRIAAILDETGMPSERLVLEVSERAIPDPAVERSLRNLAALGVSLAIDDFGSGWSSLAQLRSLPIDMVKIDRSLVASATVGESRLTMATIALAEALGLRTLAEGIETGEELLLLCFAECDLGQGYWWSEATSLESIVAQFPPPAEGALAAFEPVFDLDEIAATHVGDVEQP